MHLPTTLLYPEFDKLGTVSFASMKDEYVKLIAWGW